MPHNMTPPSSEKTIKCRIQERLQILLFIYRKLFPREGYIFAAAFFSLTYSIISLCRASQATEVIGKVNYVLSVAFTIFTAIILYRDFISSRAHGKMEKDEMFTRNSANVYPPPKRRNSSFKMLLWSKLRGDVLFALMILICYI